MSLQLSSSGLNRVDSSCSSSTTSSGSDELQVLPLGCQIDHPNPKELIIRNHITEGSTTANIVNSPHATVGNNLHIVLGDHASLYVGDGSRPLHDQANSADSDFENTSIIEHHQPHATKQKPSLASIQVLLPLAGFIAVGLVIAGIIGWRVQVSYVITNEDAPTATESASTTVDYPLYVPREGWNAMEPTRPPLPIAPALVFVGKHTGGSSCSTRAACVARVQEIQREHMEVKGLADISFNFLIGGDGRIYTGRGWGVANEGRNDSVDVAVIGDFNIEVPTTEMVHLVRRLENRGPREGGLNYANYWAVNHNQTEPTDSPGAHLFARLASNGYFFYSSAVCYRNVSGGFEIDYQCPR